MPHVRNFHYRPIKCPMCQKILSIDDDKWFCSKKCQEEWNILNGELKHSNDKKVRGQDTSG
jgi:endogenous inhibitor of DNA gyrase (YacG/DUF329 family)